MNFLITSTGYIPAGLGSVNGYLCYFIYFFFLIFGVQVYLERAFTYTPNESCDVGSYCLCPCVNSKNSRMVEWCTACHNEHGQIHLKSIGGRWLYRHIELGCFGLRSWFCRHPIGLLCYKTCSTSCPNGAVSWFPEARLQSLKLLPCRSLHFSLPANEIAFKFHGEERITLDEKMDLHQICSVQI